MEKIKNANTPYMPTGFNQSGLGLTKREYFAGIAMQGILAGIFTTKDCNMSIADVSKHSIEHAEELLKQLEK